jgi:hypothetical protein
MTEQNGFADPKLQPNPDRPPRIRLHAPTEERAGEQGIAPFIPFRELQKAKRGTGQRHNVGFSLDIEFEHPNGGTYALTSAWIAITRR